MTVSRWNVGQLDGNGQQEELGTSCTAPTHVMSLPQVLAKGQAFFSKLSRASNYTFCTAAVKSLLTVMTVRQQKPWSECCAQCKRR